MRLSEFDGQYVRVTTEDGTLFDGEAMYSDAEYMQAEYGREEEALEIDHWLFYKSDIKKAELLPDDTPRFWYGCPVHLMRLAPEPFKRIDNGTKTIELRLFDDKRRRIAVGDVIRFEDTAEEDEVLFVKVTGLYPFFSFAELYNAMPLDQCGYTKDELPAASPADMDAYYTPEEQRRWGALAIRFELL